MPRKTAKRETDIEKLAEQAKAKRIQRTADEIKKVLDAANCQMVVAVTILGKLVPITQIIRLPMVITIQSK